MRRVFRFREGQKWDGDEDIIHFLEDKLLEEDDNFWQTIKKNYKVTIIIEGVKS